MVFAGRAGLLLLVFVCASIARAGAPYFTDDPEPLAPGEWEVYFASQMGHDPGGWSGAAPFIDANYGALENVQLHMILPIVVDAREHAHNHYGFGDIELGVKWRFLQETEHRPQVAFYPLVTLPTGREDRNLGQGNFGAFLPVWLQKSFGKPGREWTTYGGGGYGINPGSGKRNWGFVGILLQRQVTDSLSLGAEAFHRTAQETDRDGSTWVNAGAIYDVNETYHVIGSVGHNVQGDTGFQMFLGLRFNFTP